MAAARTDRPRHMTVAQWASMLGVSTATGYRRVAAGEIRVVNIGPRGGRPRLRITQADADTYERQRYIPARTW